MVTPKWTLEQLLALRTLASLSTGEAFMAVGLLVDFSAAVGNEEGAPLARKLAEELGRRQISPREEALLHYFVAKSWADSQRLRIVREGASWSWDQPEPISSRRGRPPSTFPSLGSETDRFDIDDALRAQWRPAALLAKDREVEERINRLAWWRDAFQRTIKRLRR